MRNVLVATIGDNPQVLTETLWALVKEGRLGDPAELDAIHLLTTERGRATFERLRAADWLQLLCEESKLHGELATEAKAGGRLHFHIPGRRNQPDERVDDIRDADDALAFAAEAFELVIRLTEDPDTRVHASIAGGRTIMSFYLAYALSLFGRWQDDLTHVLVSPPELESCEDFWFPSQPEHRQRIEVHGRTRRAMNSKVELVGLPFVRFRQPPERFREASTRTEALQALLGRGAAPRADGEGPYEEVLILVLGQHPQIATEAAYAIARDIGCIDRVIVVTTQAFNNGQIDGVISLGSAETLERPTFEAALQRKWEDLRQHIHQPLPALADKDRFRMKKIMRTQRGHAEDIVSDEIGAKTADKILNVVGAEAAKDGTRIHAVLSGGRKAMGFYLGYSLSMLGRPQDRLYHVGPEPLELEQAPDFFFPEPGRRVYHTLTGPIRLDRDADVRLIPVPIALLGRETGSRIFDRKYDVPFQTLVVIRQSKLIDTKAAVNELKLFRHGRNRWPLCIASQDEPHSPDREICNLGDAQAEIIHILSGSPEDVIATNGEFYSFRNVIEEPRRFFLNTSSAKSNEEVAFWRRVGDIKAKTHNYAEFIRYAQLDLRDVEFFEERLVRDQEGVDGDKRAKLLRLHPKLRLAFDPEALRYLLGDH